MTSPRKPLVYIVSAPSGSGKSTLVELLLKLVSDLEFSISYTTRAPRGSERNGKQYHFVPRAEFEQMIRDHEFLEHANVHGNWYGTARRFMRDAEQKGHDLLLDIDVQGAAQVKQALPDAISIFVLPPDRKTLEWRLSNRGEDAPDVIHHRLDTAKREIENYDKYDYILINDKLEESCEDLRAIVLSARLLRSAESTSGPLSEPLSEQDKRITDRADRCRLANVKDRVKPILDSFRDPPPPA